MEKRTDRAEAQARWVRNNRPVMRLFWRAHRALLKVSGGRLGRKVNNLPVLILTTKGRKSGKARIIALNYFRDGGDLVVVASNGGLDADPAWWLNLKSRPEARVQIGRRTFDVRAEEAAGDRRAQLWARIKEESPSYAEYEKLTSRQIPVVLLHPRGSAT